MYNIFDDGFPQPEPVYDLDKITVQNVPVVVGTRPQPSIAPKAWNLYHVLPAPAIERFFEILSWSTLL